jgi:hypothetical protein
MPADVLKSRLQTGVYVWVCCWRSRQCILLL